MKKIGLKILTLLGFTQMIAVNSLANILPINGMTTGELSDQLENLFTPQGSTFAIWGVIYFLLLVFILSILVRPFEKKTEVLSRLFIVNTFLNSAWIFAWHYQYLIVSLILMIGLLVNLVKINLLIKTTPNWLDKITIQLPFTVYFGWISIATIANFTAVLVGYQWEGIGISEELWTSIILVIGIMIALSQVFYFKQIAYVIVIIWAYFGIYGKHSSALGFDNQYPSIVTLLIIAMIVMLLAGLKLSYFLLRKNLS